VYPANKEGVSRHATSFAFQVVTVTLYVSYFGCTFLDHSEQ